MGTCECVVQNGVFDRVGMVIDNVRYWGSVVAVWKWCLSRWRMVEKRGLVCCVNGVA